MKIFPVTKGMQSGLCVFLMAFCLFLTVTPVWAAEKEDAVEVTGPGSITVHYVLPDTTFRVYLVADVSGELNSKFAGSGVSDLSVTKAAELLTNYVNENNIAATKAETVSATAETEGEYKGSYSAVFDDLPVGVYLVVGEIKTSGGYYYTPTKALLLIAKTSISDDTSLNAVLNATVIPKYEMSPVPPTGSSPIGDNTVDPVTENPPDDIVDIGGDSVDQINEGNDTDTVNTVNSSPLGDDTVTTVKNAQPRLGAGLPQTGQLWWPVFVLAAGGLSSLTIGVRRRKRS
jgi:hypothetical protein